MDEKTVNISPKIFLWIFLSIVIITITIVILNSYDGQRKFNQFKNLNNLILSSNYPERLNSLTLNFIPNDTIKVKLIKENLGLLNRDFEEIDYSKVIIKGDSLYFTITSYQNYKSDHLVDIEKYLTKYESDYINYIENNKKIDLKSKFDLSADKVNNELMIKVSDKCYLLIRQYR